MLKLNTRRAGLGSVWNPGCPVKPSDKLQHVAPHLPGLQADGGLVQADRGGGFQKFDLSALKR